MNPGSPAWMRWSRPWPTIYEAVYVHLDDGRWAAGFVWGSIEAPPKVVSRADAVFVLHAEAHVAVGPPEWWP